MENIAKLWYSPFLHIFIIQSSAGTSQATYLLDIGASLKDLGKKCFAISKIEDMEYIEKWAILIEIKINLC